MISNSTEFPIAIVSTDTTILREISWTLSSLGYHVVASSDWSEHAPWQNMNGPALLLLDARDAREIRVALSTPRSASYVYRVALYEANTMANPDQLMDLGADDLVSYPLNIGELISRLRSGSRRLEFEKRFKVTTTFDQQIGIANRRGFIRQLERSLQAEHGTKDGVLIVMGIDFLPTIQSQYGYLAVEEANSLLAKLLHEKLSSEDFRGTLEAGVYGVLLQGRTVSEGQLFAENAFSELNEQNDVTIGLIPRISMSGVVLDWPSSDTANDAVNRGMTALRHVRSFGGNQIVDAKELEQEYSTWKQKFSPYQEVDAQHVMEALPLVLPLNAANSVDSSGLGVYAFSSTESLPPCVPVVDNTGLLLGVIDAKFFRKHGSETFKSLDEHLEPMSDTVKNNSGLDEILKSMESAEKDYLLVVENKRPIGYITNETLAAMTFDPIVEPDDYQLTQVDSGLNSLVVPLA